MNFLAFSGPCAIIDGVKYTLQTLKTAWQRAIRLGCPACGQSSIVERPFHIRHHCRSCRAIFKREEGFFVGAILANVVITESIVLLVCFFSLIVLGLDYNRVLWLLFSLAVVFPIAFYHHSWSFWLSLDYLVEGLPKFRGMPGRLNDESPKAGNEEIDRDNL